MMVISDERFLISGRPDWILHLRVDLPKSMANGLLACEYRISINDVTISEYHIYGDGALDAILSTLSHVADLIMHWTIGNRVFIAEGGVWDDLKKLCAEEHVRMDPESG
jgi:hypothetical protein